MSCLWDHISKKVLPVAQYTGITPSFINIMTCLMVLYIDNGEKLWIVLMPFVFVQSWVVWCWINRWKLHNQSFQILIFGIKFNEEEKRYLITVIPGTEWSFEIPVSIAQFFKSHFKFSVYHWIVWHCFIGNKNIEVVF